MKHIWKPLNIEGGLYIIKNSSPRGSKDFNFAATVAFKVGYQWTEEGTVYGIQNFLTDGLHHPIGSKEELVKHLNEDEYGFRPLLKGELIDILEHSKKGFYEK